MSRLNLMPLKFVDACSFVDANHRHHRAPQGHKFSIGAARDGSLVGVIIVGRPVARRLDDGLTLEVTRLCTDGTKNACSFLYGAAARAAKALGYCRIGTYVLESEPGTTLAAAGWKRIRTTPGQSWSVPSRTREDTHPIGAKVYYLKEL
jgi:hypothetical protein